MKTSINETDRGKDRERRCRERQRLREREREREKERERERERERGYLQVLGLISQRLLRHLRRVPDNSLWAQFYTFHTRKSGL